MRPHKEKTPKPSPMPSHDKKNQNKKLKFYKSKGHNLLGFDFGKGLQISQMPMVGIIIYDGS
jgi:hypothetical protein